MPLFEFECEKCGEITEIIQKFDDEPPEHCGEKMKRVLSGGHIAFDFRGRGFYVNDYKKKEKKK